MLNRLADWIIERFERGQKYETTWSSMRRYRAEDFMPEWYNKGERRAAWYVANCDWPCVASHGQTTTEIVVYSLFILIGLGVRYLG